MKYTIHLLHFVKTVLQKFVQRPLLGNRLEQGEVDQGTKPWLNMVRPIRRPTSRYLQALMDQWAAYSQAKLPRREKILYVPDRLTLLLYTPPHAQPGGRQPSLCSLQWTQYTSVLFVLLQVDPATTRPASTPIHLITAPQLGAPAKQTDTTISPGVLTTKH